MKKILIIDDNPELRENTAEIMELANYTVSTAENGKMGVEQALKELPDLIICDIMMPVLDGYGVYHLLSKHKETAGIPFIFLTAKSEKSDLRKGMELGADDYLVKPFDGTELLQVIEVRLKKADLLKQQYGGPEALTQFLADAEGTGKVQLTSDEREIVSYAKKGNVYRKGSRPRYVYYVVSGKVRITRASDDGKEFITSIHGAGAYFGYNAVLEDLNYKDEAHALEETQLMLIPREDFLQLVSNDREIAKAFIRLISKDVIGKEEILLQLAYATLRKKVAFGLIQLAEKYKGADAGATMLSLSRENMAQSMGIATESLIRTLGDFKEEKLIEIQAGKVFILDEKGLLNLRY